jgi:biopolymer transport protein ExbB
MKKKTKGFKVAKLMLMIIAVSLFAATHLMAQTAKKYALFDDVLTSDAQWKSKSFSKKGGYASKENSQYIYVKKADDVAAITGLSIPIRENPAVGEYRYISFAWVKWGGAQIAMKFEHDPAAKYSVTLAKKYNYTYFAGEINDLTGFRLGTKAPGGWLLTTRDLWKDFGDFTLTGISFICPEKRDAGFDAIYLGRSLSDLGNAPQIALTEIASPQEVGGDEGLSSDENEQAIADETFAESEKTDGVQIDWAAQIKAGGIWMYPLYLLGLMALIVALQRVMTSRGGRLAPKKLRIAVRDSLAKNDIDTALVACNKYPSTLADTFRFIFLHREAGREAVSQTAGDMAARDIRTHVARIYPLSVIASIAPLLGLLGTIVGMIEAFGLVALYGDEGGAAILSDSISKALITTAAGLIIAAPSVYVYFVIKNRIMRLASLIEVEIENVITVLYLSDRSQTL